MSSKVANARADVLNRIAETSPVQAQRTKGVARLATKLVDGRTRLDIFYQESAAKIRIPESFDGSMEAVLINTSGGLTGSDRITWAMTAGPGTRLTVTTQACERVYKSSGGHAEVNSIIRVGEGASLHWLPQETILFDQSALKRTLEVDLAEDAEFIGLEAVLVGRKAMGELVQSGLFRDRWRVRRSGRLVHAEDVHLSGTLQDLMAHGSTLSGHQAFATLLYCGDHAEALLPKIRDLLADRLAGVSAWNGKLVIRMLAPEGFDLRKMLIPAISLLRKGHAAPKVWNL